MMIIDHARSIGITLRLEGEMVHATGDRAAIQKFAPTIKANKPQIMRELKGEVPFPRSRHLVGSVEIISTPPADDSDFTGSVQRLGAWA